MSAFHGCLVSQLQVTLVASDNYLNNHPSVGRLVMVPKEINDSLPVRKFVIHWQVEAATLSWFRLDSRWLEEEWREHLQAKLIRERLWLEERMEAMQTRMSRELDSRMARFKSEWVKNEEIRRSEWKKEKEEAKRLESVKEERLRERELRKEEIREVERVLQSKVEEVREELRLLQKQKEEHQIVQEEIRKSVTERERIEAEKRELEKEKERLKEQKERMATQERNLLVELAEQWKSIALGKLEDVRERERKEMERWKEVEERILEAKKNEDLLKNQMEILEEKRQATIEVKQWKEIQEVTLEEERKILQMKTRQINKEWKNIGIELMKIKTEKEGLEKEKDTERAMQIYRERVAEKEVQRQKIKLERKENIRRMLLDEEWRNVEAERVKIEEERNVVEMEKKLAEKEIRRQRRKLEREADARQRREYDPLLKRDDVVAIVRTELAVQKQPDENDLVVEKSETDSWGQEKEKEEERLAKQTRNGQRVKKPKSFETDMQMASRELEAEQKKKRKGLKKERMEMDEANRLLEREEEKEREDLVEDTRKKEKKRVKVEKLKASGLMEAEMKTDEEERMVEVKEKRKKERQLLRERRERERHEAEHMQREAEKKERKIKNRQKEEPADVTEAEAGTEEDYVTTELMMREDEEKKHRVTFCSPLLTFPHSDGCNSLRKQEAENLERGSNKTEQRNPKETTVPAVKFTPRTKKVTEPDSCDEFDKELEELLKMY
ncbi:hypothetical protein NFI96_006861 [Prochilodus magdalenae]|nr:hypothetical protein NFI96_006861 [Prochilodus magdalenae]